MYSNTLAAELPFHVAIIMDGNGRWAQSRGLPRTAGHRAGAQAVDRIVEAACGMGIRVLTLYAFSSDNWKRPQHEVDTLMELFGEYLNRERQRCVRNGIRLRVIGRRDRLPDAVLASMKRAEEETQHGHRMELRLAVDYSARDAILSAANGGRVTRSEMAAALGPEVDLLVRTGGERRLSDFLLWECAYAELWFTPCMWPDFGRNELQEALDEYSRRERRFGAIPHGNTPGDTMQFL